MGNFNSRPAPTVTIDDSERHPTRAFQPGRSIKRLATFRANNTTNNVETDEPPEPRAYGYEKLVNVMLGV